jgi:hypothetical protein
MRDHAYVPPAGPGIVTPAPAAVFESPRLVSTPVRLIAAGLAGAMVGHARRRDAHPAAEAPAARIHFPPTPSNSRTAAP